MKKTKTLKKALKKWAKKNGYKFGSFKTPDAWGYITPPGNPFVKPRSLADVLRSEFTPPPWMKDDQAVTIDTILAMGDLIQEFPRWGTEDPAGGEPTIVKAEPETDKGLSTNDLLHYAGVHSQRMEDEGFTKTALVIGWLANKIIEQREELKKVTQPGNQ